MQLGHPKRNSRGALQAAGFTILELMVATTIFTVILLVVAVGVVSFTNSYFKGITNSITQANARAVMSQITESIQFGRSVNSLVDGSGVRGICIDNTLYAYTVGQEVTDAPPSILLHQGHHGLLATTGSDCSTVIPGAVVAALRSPGTVGVPPLTRELLSQHVRVGALDVTPLGQLYTIHVRLIYGDDDLLTSTAWGSALCAGGHAGNQFCAVSDLTTTVQKRL